MKEKRTVYMVDIPGCGASWIASMLRFTVIDKFKLDDPEMESGWGSVKRTFDFLQDRPESKTWTYEGTHDGAINGWYGNFIPYDLLPHDKHQYAEERVFLVLRDPRDALVSSFRKYRNIYEATPGAIGLPAWPYPGGIKGYIRDCGIGIKKYLTFWKIWYENQEIPDQFSTVWYEDVLKSPYSYMVSLLKMFNVDGIEMEHVEYALKRTAVTKKEGRGIEGAYQNFMENNDLKYINKAAREVDCPYWREHEKNSGARRSH